MNTRYVLISILLFSVLGALWFWGHDAQRRGQDQVSTAVQVAQQVQEARARIRSRLWQAEYLLSSFLISPNDGLRTDIEAELHAALAAVAQFEHTPGLSDLRDVRATTAALRRQIKHYRAQAEQLMQIRRDRQRMFPAMRPVVSKMYPANQGFVNTLSLASAEEPPPELAQTYAELHLLWTKMISEFRVFMAFRTGTFGSPEVGMPVYSHNVTVVHNQITDTLKKLDQQVIDLDLEFEHRDHYLALRNYSTVWFEAYQQVERIQSSDGWRADLPILRNELRPTAAAIQRLLSSLDAIARHQYQSTKKSLDAIVSATHWNYVTIGTVMLLALLGAWLALQRGIFKPVVAVARVMRAESRQTGSGAQLEASGVAEIDDLIQAFETLRDEVRMREGALEHQLYHDALTGLPNRRSFLEGLSKDLAQGHRTGEALALILIGLDRFKYLNETYSQEVGDQILQSVAQRLRRCRSDGETLAHLGGDAFVLALDGADSTQARRRAAQLHTQMDPPFQLTEHTIRVSCSLGIALFPDHGVRADELLSHGDLALKQAKSDRSVIAIYSRERHGSPDDELNQIELLRSSIAGRTLELSFQPQVQATTGEVIGFEALLVAPAFKEEGIGTQEVIGIAERSGLIRPLTEWVLSTALEEHRRWRSRGLSLTLSVNLSVITFHNPELVSMISSAITAWRMPPEMLQLEITETDMMSDPARAEQVLAELSRMGVRISMDDFGTGYSSLQHLRSMPINELKIDKSYVRALRENDRERAIVQTIIDFAHNLDIVSVAEGVEDEDDARLLTEMGCDILQGYHFSRPMSEEMVLGWVESQAEITRLA